MGHGKNKVLSDVYRWVYRISEVNTIVVNKYTRSAFLLLNILQDHVVDY